MVMTAVDCPFCEIVLRDDRGAREVYRDEYVVAFFPTEPAVLGHTMVAPREHVEDIWGLEEDTAAHLARVTVRLAAAIGEAINPEGLNVIQSNGEAATQSILHLHVHLVPRWSDDAMGRIWPKATHFSETQKDRALRAVQKACNRIGRQ